jgi:peptidoglycan hydrolase CwlO-like protein
MELVEKRESLEKVEGDIKNKIKKENGDLSNNKSLKSVQNELELLRKRIETIEKKRDDLLDEVEKIEHEIKVLEKDLTLEYGASSASRQHTATNQIDHFLDKIGLSDNVIKTNTELRSITESKYDNSVHEMNEFINSIEKLKDSLDSKIMVLANAKSVEGTMNANNVTFIVRHEDGSVTEVVLSAKEMLKGLEKLKEIKAIKERAVEIHYEQFNEMIKDESDEKKNVLKRKYDKDFLNIQYGLSSKSPETKNDFTKIIDNKTFEFFDKYTIALTKMSEANKKPLINSLDEFESEIVNLENELDKFLKNEVSDDIENHLLKIDERIKKLNVLKTYLEESKSLLGLGYTDEEIKKNESTITAVMAQMKNVESLHFKVLSMTVFKAAENNIKDVLNLYKNAVKEINYYSEFLSKLTEKTVRENDPTKLKLHVKNLKDQIKAINKYIEGPNALLKVAGEILNADLHRYKEYPDMVAKLKERNEKTIRRITKDMMMNIEKLEEEIELCREDQIEHI